MKRVDCGAPRARTGYTLVEMLVVISLLGVTLVSTGVMLHVLLKVDRTARREHALNRALPELAMTFRRDVRGSVAADLDQAGRIMSLSASDGHTVQYRLDEDSVERQVLAADDALQARERYHLPGCTVRFEESSDDHRAAWTLAISRPPAALSDPSSHSESPVQFPVRATLNAHGLPDRGGR